MTIKDDLEKYDLFDNSIVKIGLKEYQRDFELIAYLHDAEDKGYYSYLFKGCVEVNYKCILPEAAFSMAEANINLKLYETDPEADGYFWISHADVYPGWQLIENDKDAMNYTKKHNYDFIKIQIETNVFQLDIIFNDLDITFLGDKEAGIESIIRK